jgi:hypothetical protein
MDRTRAPRMMKKDAFPALLATIASVPSEAVVWDVLKSTELVRPGICARVERKPRHLFD